MKTKITLGILTLMTAVSFAGTPASQSLGFDDGGLGGGTPTSGTYNSSDTFGFDVLLTFNGYNAGSLSFWLETDTAFAGSLSITGVTYGTTFPDHPNTTFPVFFDSGGGENFDLGSSPHTGTVPPGTYFVAHITFAISGATPGAYDLRSTVTPPHTSEVTGFDGTAFTDNNLPATHYSVTIVPEPRTLALVGFGAIFGFGLIARRRSRFATFRRRRA